MHQPHAPSPAAAAPGAVVTPAAASAGGGGLTGAGSASVLCEAVAHNSPLAAMAWYSDTSLLATASTRGTVLRVHRYICAHMYLPCSDIALPCYQHSLAPFLCDLVATAPPPCTIYFRTSGNISSRARTTIVVAAVTSATADAMHAAGCPKLRVWLHSDVALSLQPSTPWPGAHPTSSHHCWRCPAAEAACTSFGTPLDPLVW
jgi:hypothetical protein